MSRLCLREGRMLRLALIQLTLHCLGYHHLVQAERHWMVEHRLSVLLLRHQQRLS